MCFASLLLGWCVLQVDEQGGACKIAAKGSHHKRQWKQSFGLEISYCTPVEEVKSAASTFGMGTAAGGHANKAHKSQPSSRWSSHATTTTHDDAARHQQPNSSRESPANWYTRWQTAKLHSTVQWFHDARCWRIRRGHVCKPQQIGQCSTTWIDCRRSFRASKTAVPWTAAATGGDTA